MERIAKESAREMLMRALEAEVNEFLGRACYEGAGEFCGYRNGYDKERQVAISLSEELSWGFR